MLQQKANAITLSVDSHNELNLLSLLIFSTSPKDSKCYLSSADDFFLSADFHKVLSKH